MPTQICLYTYYYIPFLNTSLSITDKNIVNQIDERNRFPDQICASHHHVHPIACVQQLPVIKRSNDFYKGTLD